MQIINITSINDERVATYTNLTEVQLRNRLEPERGIFIAESPKVIERALAAGREPVSLLVEEAWLDDMNGMFQQINARWGDQIPVYVASSEQLKKLTGYRLHRGALAAMRRWKLPTVAQVCKNARRVAIMENIVDHTNVGALMRSAAALEVDAVLATPSCGDPLYRRAARVSMGTVFQVPWTRIDSQTLTATKHAGNNDNDPNAALNHAGNPGNLHTKEQDNRLWPIQGLRELNNLGFTTVAMALTDDSISLDELTRRLNNDSSEPDHIEKIALIFGTEGDGLTYRTIANTDLTVKIPMSNGVDSLNVAASSAVAFYATRYVHR